MRTRGIAKIVRRSAIGLMLLLVLSGWLYERHARSAALRQYPPPGRLVSLETHDLHIDCRGEGEPTVVLEAGMDPLGSLSWTLQHDQLALITRTCAYDRAGIAWSDIGPGPRVGERIAVELHELLGRAGETGPFVLVAHSMGGPYVRIFAGKYPEEIAGIVLVESSHPEQFSRLPKIGDQRPPPKLLIWAMPLVRKIGVTRHMMTDELRYEALPPDKQRALFAVSAGSIGAMVREFGHIAESLAQANEVVSFGNVPLIVLSAVDPPDASPIPNFDQDQANEGHAIWLAMQRELVKLSSNGQHVPISNATHYIQFSNPDAVIDAVTTLLQEIRH